MKKEAADKEAKTAVIKDANEIKKAMGSLMVELAQTTNDKEKVAIVAAFTTLGWILYGGPNALSTILKKSAWDKVPPQVPEDIQGETE
jgi:hypothetical protein